jgi:tetratricopeptide (TPR) repeat protein
MASITNHTSGATAPSGSSQPSSTVTPITGCSNTSKRRHSLLLLTQQGARNCRARIVRTNSKNIDELDHLAPSSCEHTATNGSTTSAKCDQQQCMDKASDIIAALNEVGIANLYAGDARVAQESFINALSSCSTSSATSYLQKKANQIMNFQVNTDGSNTSTTSGFTSEPHPNFKTTASSVSLDQQQPASTTIIGTSAATAEQEAHANMHVYQREEYDEGMHIYKEALYLDDCEASTHFRDATLMYNVGQTHLRTRQYEDAKRWFSVSFATFEEYKERTLPASAAPHGASCRLHGISSAANGSKTLLSEVKILHNIAFCYYCLGQNDSAAIHYQSAFRHAQEDFDVAACCNSIGILHLCAGDSVKAMECLELALITYKRLLGDKASPVATCLSNIARVFFSRQEFATALTLFQDALEIRQVQGKEGSFTHSPVDEAAAMFNIGQTYQKLGKIQEALTHFGAFRELAEPVLGKNHRDVVTCIKAMACIEYENGNICQACDLLEQAVQCSKTGSPSLELICLLRDMGCLYSMTNQPEKSLARHLETLQLQRLFYGAEDRTNPSIMVTLLHVAQNQKKLGKYTKALQVYRGVYDIQLEVYGPKSLEVAATLCSIGLMLYLKQELQSSLNYYREALIVRQEHFKTNDNFDISATFNSIGLIAFKMKKLDLAKDAFLNCIRIRIKLETTDCHKDIVTLYSNLGTVYLANGEDKEAIQMFAESIRLERKVLGENHLGVAVSLQHLAQLHQDRGELELAHWYFAEALAITKQVDESTMANKQRTICTLLNLMGNIHLMKAEVPQMMECFTEASRVKVDDNSNGTNGNNGGDHFNNLVIAGYTFYGISKMHPPCAPEA